MSTLTPDQPPAAQPRSRPAVPIAWLLLGILLLASILRAPLLSVGPLVGVIRHDLGLSGTLMGMLASLPVLVFALVSPFAAGLSRRYGLETTLLAASLLLLSGLLLRSGLPGEAALLAGTAVLSAGIALGNVLLPALVKRSLPERVALVTGIQSATMSLVAGIAAAVALPLSHLGGWRLSLGIWALPALLSALVWGGLRRGSRQARLAPEPLPQTGGNLWTQPAAWVLSLFMGIQSLVFYSLANFMPAILTERGINPLEASWYSTVMQWVSLLGIFGISLLAGRVPRLQGIAVGSAALTLSGLLGLWLGPLNLAWLWASLLGIGCAATFSLSLILFSVRTRTPQAAASLSGMAQAVGYLVAATGPLGAGYLFDRTGSWTSSLLLLSLLLATQCVLAWFAGQSSFIGSADAG
ncbi:MFS transporter [Deinococcus sp. Marseille-Q6407]|uniref:MFS transporter n=1 Tax=Deinococcus sp. Marseille-Q6407 TaxID=2969223 RepID=UPI0021C17E71|nr:MFS transporter [Deinococcus sp. Marseille-Q6407]